MACALFSFFCLLNNSYLIKRAKHFNSNLIFRLAFKTIAAKNPQPKEFLCHMAKGGRVNGYAIDFQLILIKQSHNKRTFYINFKSTTIKTTRINTQSGIKLRLLK